MNEEIIPIFPVPVHISKYEKDLTKEQDFIKILVTCQMAVMVILNLLILFITIKRIKKLKEFILSQLNIYTKTILLSSDILIPTISWTNKNPKGSKHHEHVHPNSIVSGVFYFSINDSAPIQFHKHDFGGIKLDSDKYNNYNNGMYSVKMNKSELVLFPSTTRHSVPENKSDEIRYSLSFNTFTDAVIGSTDKLTYLNLKELSNGNT